jgi:hypothetical protein
MEGRNGKRGCRVRVNFGACLVTFPRSNQLSPKMRPGNTGDTTVCLQPALHVRHAFSAEQWQVLDGY